MLGLGLATAAALAVALISLKTPKQGWLHAEILKQRVKRKRGVRGVNVLLPFDFPDSPLLVFSNVEVGKNLRGGKAVKKREKIE